MEKLLIILLMSVGGNLFAQTNCPCCDEYHKQFDFWVGNWMVFDTLGNKVGENEISKIEYNCALTEHWKGNGGGTGTSMNYFDNSDSTWNQLWVDNSGSHLKLKGHFVLGEMVLKSELIGGKNGSSYYNQITWTKIDNETVIQLWEVYDSVGEYLSTIFKGIYQLKTPSQEKYSEYIESAWKLYQLKQFKESAEEYKKAFDQLDGEAYANDRYNAACSNALAGDIENSFYHLFKLAESPKSNYRNYDHIITDTDLTILHIDKRWDELIKIVKSNNDEVEK